MSPIRLFLVLAAVATATVLVLLLVSDANDGYTTPAVWINVPLVLFAIEILTFVALGNREVVQRRHAESDLRKIRSIR